MIPADMSYVSMPAESHSGTSLSLLPFDQRHYRKLIRARGETIRNVVASLQPVVRLETALDAGCGVGFFAQILHQQGLRTQGFDARLENVVEARRRFPSIPFAQWDVEDPEITRLGTFDLVLSFGLVYHLENPMLAIRHLRALSRKGLLLESMCMPGSEPEMLVRDEPALDDQSLGYVALYPSEGCLVKMLYRAGFAAIYRVAALPEHDDFHETPEHVRRRTVLFASVTPVWVPGLDWIAEPRERRDPWAKNLTTNSRAALQRRIGRFLAKPSRAKYAAMARRAQRVLPMPIPLRLPFGAWWLAETSALDRDLLSGDFERAELRWVERFLQPGMIVLDIGAHHGLYTLLASKGVGRHGRVISFEPSPRECRRLRRHLRVNRCTNVRIEQYALGDSAREADLFLVEGSHDWCNSLRPPDVEERTCAVTVEVRRLDDALDALGISQVDFIKLDVEGAELSVLRGAAKLLRSELRPVILAEVQDLRTRPWGYSAKEIVEVVSRFRYRWFELDEDGALQPAPTNLGGYDSNLVALPEERVEELLPSPRHVLRRG